MGARAAEPRSPLLPGLLVVLGIAGLAWGADAGLRGLVGRGILEPLVLAVLIGAVVRHWWAPGESHAAGIRLAAGPLLEGAVVLMGLTLDPRLLVSAGPRLAIGVVVIVSLALIISFALARSLGISSTLAALLACGNAICGNSAIAAVSPAIGATQEDAATAIAFTAILGVIVVVVLPLAADPLRLDGFHYGVVTGLTVYAVPQVLAAAYAKGALAGQIATLVKLARVALLAPLLLFAAGWHRRRARDGADIASRDIASGAVLPWFIGGFVAMCAIRATGFVPTAAIDGARTIASGLTVLAMAALGLGVDLTAIRRVGVRVALAVTGSLLLLFVLALVFVRTVPIAPH